MIRTKIKHRYFIPLVLLLATFVVPLFPQKAEAVSVTYEDNVTISFDLRWINRAEIEMYNLDATVNDTGLTLSPESKTIIGRAGVPTLIQNFKDVNQGIYKDGNLLDNDNALNRPSDMKAIGRYGKDKCGRNMETVLIPNLDFNTGNNEAVISDREFIVTAARNGACDSFLDRSQYGKEIKTNIGDEMNRDIWFKMNNDQELERVDNGDKFTRQTPGEPNKYTGPQNGGEYATVTLREDSLQSDELLVLADFNTQDVDRGEFSVRVKRDNAEAGKSDEIAGPDSVSPDGPPDPECEVKMTNPLTWLVCPLISAAATAVNELDNAITSQLTIQTEGSTSVYDEENSGSGVTLFGVWGAFRYISLAILVIIGLIMIISQAMSFGIFDAYTIKKVLPKILIGVIGISVSWYLCKFAIDIFNDLGVGVRSLLYGPFKNTGGVKFDDGATTLLLGGGGVALAALGIVGALSFALTALMAVVIAFGILVFRQVIIMLLVVTAPVAIVCWILPNTEKVWKMWWDFFSKALIVFPIIALFIAGGRVIAELAMMQGSQAGENDLLATTIAFIAYFGPYFALPAAFRMAGGALATVGGFANDRSRGAFDRLKNFRGERKKNRIEAFRNAGLYNEDTRRGRIGNKIGGWMFDADERIPYYAGKSGGKYNPFRNRSMVLGSKIEHAAKEQTIEMFKTWNNDHDANDKFFAAVGGSLTDLSAATAQRFREAGLADEHGNGVVLDSRDKFERAINIMSQSDDSTERVASAALSRNMAPILNRTRDGNGYASIAGASMLGLSAHGFGSEESMIELADKIKAEQGGHNDFAESMLVFSEVNGSSGRKAGYSHSIDKEGNLITGKQAGRDWARAASKSAGDIARLKKRQAVEDTEALIGIMQYGQTDDDGREALRQKWAAEGLDDVAIRNRTDGYMSDAAIMDENATPEQREAAAKAKDAFMDKVRMADQTLFALQQSYTGAATDTMGAIRGVIDKNSRIAGNIGGTMTDAERQAAIRAGQNGGGAGALGGADLGGGGIGNGGL